MAGCLPEEAIIFLVKENLSRCKLGKSESELSCDFCNREREGEFWHLDSVHWITITVGWGRG